MFRFIEKFRQFLFRSDGGALQCFYAIRILAWGAILTFDTKMVLSEPHNGLEFLKFFPSLELVGIILLLVGSTGIVSLLKKNFQFSFLFSILNVFILSFLAITNIIHSYDAHLTFINYLVETLAAAWLIFRLPYDYFKRKKENV